MRVLDRQRHPLWSAVVPSTVSGLCVLAIAAAIGSLYKARLLTTAVPLWSLVAVAGALLVLSCSMLLQQRSRSYRAKRVFLVISAFDQKHYLAELIRNVHAVLEQHGYALELKIPHRDYSNVSQLHCLKLVLDHKDDYIGGFVIPVITRRADRMQSDLVDFCKKVAVPVVFLDVEPFGNESHYPANTAFVGYSAAEIGEAAADWAAERLLRKQTSCPIVLVIGGDSQHHREQRFKEQLSAKLSPVRVIEDSAGFDRLRAREVTRKQLKCVRLKGQQLEVIFCTNDEMALGAVDALLFGDPATAAETVVVGVDGTPQARALIEAGPNPLHATVVQDSYKVAETGVDLLDRMIRKDPVPTRTHLPSEMLARD
jgi:DNA-binding LacI/PurR family transcriptional regulator